MGHSYQKSRPFKDSPATAPKSSPFEPRPFAEAPAKASGGARRLNAPETPPEGGPLVKESVPGAGAVAQFALMHTHTAGLKMETRNPNARLRSLGGNRYREEALDNYPVDLTYLPDTDQYLVAEDTYWDPVTGDALSYLGNNVYQGMDGASRFGYVRGRYVAIAGDADNAPEPALAADLRNLIDRIWHIRDTVLAQEGAKAQIDYIYTRLYSNGGKPQLADGGKMAVAEQLVDFAAGKEAHLQGKFKIPPDNKVVNGIDDLHRHTAEAFSNAVQDAAWKALFKGYYYFRINTAVAPNTRIVINASPANVPENLNRLYPILGTYNAIVSAVKAAGPQTAAQKIDSIVVYANGTANAGAWQNLLTAVRQAGLATVNAVPGLTEQVDPGIAVADEPPRVEGRSISFGQKRVILAYMALTRATSKLQFTTLVGEFFEDAGIDTGRPARERAQARNPAVVAELADLLAQLTPD